MIRIEHARLQNEHGHFEDYCDVSGAVGLAVLDRILEVVRTHTLNPSLAPFARTSFERGSVTFWGNFETISAGFRLETDEQPLIHRIFAAFKDNCQSADYRRVLNEYKSFRGRWEP